MKVQESHVVTCFLRNRGEILLLKRSEEVGSYRGLWGAVSGYVEANDPTESAWREIKEETGKADKISLIRKGDFFLVEDDSLGKSWIIHPFLFEVEDRQITLNWEHCEARWVFPPELFALDTVPKLWTSYVKVAPSIESIEEDFQHGSVYLSFRAMEVVRDTAAALARNQGDHAEGRRLLISTVECLLAQRPSMAALQNRLHRIMHESRPHEDLFAIESTASREIQNAYAAEQQAAEKAAVFIAGRRVLSLSRSESVLGAIRVADPEPDLTIAESRPGLEGVSVAETLAYQGMNVTLVSDNAVASMLSSGRVDLALIGCDTILSNGDVVNKVGTYGMALAAKKHKIPCYVVASSDKVSPEKEVPLSPCPREMVYPGEAPIDVDTTMFESSPGQLFSGVITEYGILAQDELRDLAFELKFLRNW